jgi:hypothetical protein
MKRHEQKAADSGKEAVESERPGDHKAGEDDCRCKEVSKKSMPELIKLMLDDLAFWKKRER